MRGSGIAVLAAGWIVAVTGGSVRAADTVPAVPPPIPAAEALPATSDPRAAAALVEMGAFYSGMRSFQVDLRSVLRSEGTTMKNEMTSTFAAAMERPNRLAVTLQSGMAGGSLYCDGKTVAVLMPTMKKYTSEEAPRRLAGILDAMNGVLVMGMGYQPFSALLAPDPAKALFKGKEPWRFVGDEKLDDTAVRHLEHKEGMNLAELWIASGDMPFLLQASFTIDMAATIQSMTPEQRAKMSANTPTSMVTVLTLSGWKTNSEVPPAAFAFVPPDGAQLVSDFAGSFARPETPSPLVGQPAPEFQLADLDGKEVPLSSLRGKVVVLDFWATWCPPCVKALPKVAAIAARADGVAFYAVDLREDAAAIRAFQKEQELAFPVLRDMDGKMAALYGAKAIPQTVVIGPDGTVRAVHVGYHADIGEKLAAEIAAARN